MPVLEHEVHETVREKEGAVYGCWNRVGFRGGYYAPDRRYYGIGGFDTISVFVEHCLSTDCRYEMSEKDTKCNGCKHRGSGEAYAQMVRSNGA